MKFGKWRNEIMGMKELIDNEVMKWEWRNEMRMKEWNEANGRMKWKEFLMKRWKWNK